MKKILLALVLAVALAAPALSNPIYGATGSCWAPTCPITANHCGFIHLTGQAPFADNHSWVTPILVDVANDIATNSNQPCTTTGHMWLATISSGIGYIFDDEAAQVTTYGTGTCPDSIYVTGNEYGMAYVCTFKSPSTNADGSIWYQFSMYRPCCTVSAGVNGSAVGDPSFKKGFAR